jgi:hypothetical protein
MNTIRKLTAVVIMLGAIGAARAAIMEYTDQASFEANTSTLTTVDFSDEFPAGDWTSTGPNSDWNNVDAMLLGHGSYNSYIQFPDAPVSAVGLTLYNNQDPQTIPYTRIGLLVDGVETTFDLEPAYKTAAEGTFYGFIADNTITQITLHKSGDPTESYGSAAVTEMSYGVPEPSTLALLAAGSLAAIRRKKSVVPA